MSEELHEITYRQQVTESYTRAQIEKIATEGGYFEDVAEACREWLEANPKQGLTRGEFDALPDGSVVESRCGTQLVKIGTVGAYTNSDCKVQWVSPCDSDLADLTVVSTTAPPPLDSVRWVRDKYTDLWGRLGNDTWLSLDDGSEVSTAELLSQYGPIAPLISGPQIGGEA